MCNPVLQGGLLYVSVVPISCMDDVEDPVPVVRWDNPESLENTALQGLPVTSYL